MIFVSVCAPNIKKIVFVSVCAPSIRNYFRECLCNEYKIILGSVCAVNEIFYTACFKIYNVELCFKLSIFFFRVDLCAF
jgi:hypothetical protein